MQNPQDYESGPNNESNPYYATESGGGVAPPVVVQGQVVGTSSNATANLNDHNSQKVEYGSHPDTTTTNHSVKGEHQPKRCNDVFWAILFYSHLGLMAYLAAANSSQMFQTFTGEDGGNNDRRVLSSSNENVNSTMGEGTLSVFNRALSTVWTHHFSKALGVGSGRTLEDNEEFEANPNDVIILLSVTGVIGLGFSSFSLTFMMYFAEILIKTALFFNIFTSVIMVLAGLLSANIALVALGGIYFAFSFCYIRAVWSRIPFAAQNLITAVTSIKANIGVTFYAYLSLLSFFGWSLWWGVSTMSTMFVMGDCDAQGQCQNQVSGIILFLFLVSYYWTWQVIKNVVHVTVAGTVGTWWFVPSEANSFCSTSVRNSFFRAITTSFGSICLGSLIVAIVQAARHMLHRLRATDDGLLYCLAECCLRCIEAIIEYFNEWAFIYVAIYGYNFIDAAKGVVTLFKTRGWTTIITDNLISNVLTMVSIGVGVLTGLIGALVANVNNMELEIGGFALGFFFGFTLTQVLMGVVGSAVNAVIVCYAEDPAVFQTNYPQLSDAMRSTWREAWPADFKY